MGTILYLVVILGIFWFFLIRPQQQQAKKRAEMLTSLKVDDKIVTIGGICGVIKQLTDDKIFVEIADGLVIEMLRTSISSIESDEELKNPFEEDDEFDDEDDDDDLYYDEDDDDVIDVDNDRNDQADQK